MPRQFILLLTGCLALTSVGVHGQALCNTFTSLEGKYNMRYSYMTHFGDVLDLKIKKNFKYSLTSTTHFHHFKRHTKSRTHSSGKWIMKGDTLFLLSNKNYKGDTLICHEQKLRSLFHNETYTKVK